MFIVTSCKNKQDMILDLPGVVIDSVILHNTYYNIILIK